MISIVVLVMFGPGLHVSSLVEARVVHTLVLGGYRCEFGSHLSNSSSGGAIKLRDCVVDGGAGDLVDFACCFVDAGLHVVAYVFVVWTTFPYPHTSRRRS